MKPTILERLGHIREAIGNLHNLLAGKSLDDYLSQVHLRSAAERYFEIISEGSRHIPKNRNRECPRCLGNR